MENKHEVLGFKPNYGGLGAKPIKPPKEIGGLGQSPQFLAIFVDF